PRDQRIQFGHSMIQHHPTGLPATNHASAVAVLTRELTHAFAQTYWWTLAIGAVAVVPALILPRRRRLVIADSPPQ
ncbi:hypothetical protein, partial [Nocardia sp. NPDC004711]